jgi:acyl-CoA dehydrogenase
MLPQLHQHTWMDSDIEAYRDQLRRYIANEMTPHNDAWRDQGYVPREIWQGFGEMGFLLPEIGEEYGGAGAPLSYQLVALDELARAGLPPSTSSTTAPPSRSTSGFPGWPVASSSPPSP